MDWIDLGIKAAGLAVLVYGLLQLRETIRKRHIDLYWAIADRYLSDEGRRSRGAIAEIEKELEIPGWRDRELAGEEVDSYAADYLRAFHDRLSGTPEKETDAGARDRLRLLNQAGVLLKKKLVDRELLFGLLAPGVEVDMNALRVVERAYDMRHKFRVYPYISTFIAEYHKWTRSHPSDYGTGDSGATEGTQA